VNNLRFSPGFDSNYDNRLTKIQKHKVLGAIERFLDNPDDKELRNHQLKWGKWKGYWSITVEGDLRIHYRPDEKVIYLVAVGSHKQLYHDSIDL
jgi:addiction module RelE/StbE family toxin